MNRDPLDAEEAFQRADRDREWWDEPDTADDLRESPWSFAQLRAGDTVTSTVEEAAAFERARSMAFDDHYDYDRPTLAELDADAIHDGEWRTR